jgi:chromosome segregation ATPase
MKKLIPFLAVLFFALAGCNNEKTENQVPNEVLVAQLDSMQQILDAAQYKASLLEQVGTYMDSIDSNRKWIKLNLEGGISNEDYIERMKSLNQYVQKAEWTIGELEKTRSAYASQVKRLKNEIADKNLEIQSLQQAIAQYQGENQELQIQLSTSELELVNSQVQLDISNEKVDKANDKIANLLSTVKLTEAESFFAQGEGMEEIANRTQLAPKRKKASLESALEMYTKAESLGHPDAAAKITSLKEKLKID